MGSRKWYTYVFSNIVSEKEKSECFEKYALPEIYTVSQQLVLNAYVNFDFKKEHQPLLFIGGSSDNIFPAGLTQTIARKYSDKNGKVDLKIFEGKSLFLCGEKG